MNFGKLTEEQLKEVNFALPPDGQLTAKTLKGLRKIKQPAFYVGCAKWGIKEWKNLIYPPKTKPSDFLDEYVKQFNSIELNAVFYSIPKVENIRKWKAKADDSARQGFIFCPKFSRSISHMKRLKKTEASMDKYLSSIYELGPYLGPCFLQLADKYLPSNMESLKEFLESLPEDLKVFVEVRHESWFSDPGYRKELFEMLKSLNKGAIITDVSGRRDCLHMELTIPEVFIRFVGNGSKHHASDLARVDDWVLRLKSWLDQGLKKVYFFVHQHDERDTPILANYAIQQFNTHLGAKLSEIDFLGDSADITK